MLNRQVFFTKIFSGITLSSPPACAHFCLEFRSKLHQIVKIWGLQNLFWTEMVKNSNNFKQYVKMVLQNWFESISSLKCSIKANIVLKLLLILQIKKQRYWFCFEWVDFLMIIQISWKNLVPLWRTSGFDGWKSLIVFVMNL